MMGAMAHTILADVIGPALFLENWLLSVWIILAGLLIEYFLVWRATSLGPWRSIMADVAINAASTVMGIILIPLGRHLPGNTFPVFFFTTYSV